MSFRWPEPWRDSDAARTIGPLETVARPSLRQSTAVLGWVAGILLLPGCAGLFCLVPCHPIVRGPRVSLEVPLLPVWSLVLAWLAVVVWIVLWARSRLRWRLLVGQRGIALWSPQRAIVARWDELGTVWHRSLLDSGYPTEAEQLVLVRVGERLLITNYFAGHQRIIARVLAELHDRTTGAVAWRTPQPGPTGEGIVSPEDGVAEP